MKKKRKRGKGRGKGRERRKGKGKEEEGGEKWDEEREKGWKGGMEGKRCKRDGKKHNFLNSIRNA